MEQNNLEGPNDIIQEYLLKFDFRVTNNQVEYKALIAGLHITKEVKAMTIWVMSNS